MEEEELDPKLFLTKDNLKLLKEMSVLGECKLFYKNNHTIYDYLYFKILNVYEKSTGYHNNRSPKQGMKTALNTLILKSHESPIIKDLLYKSLRNRVAILEEKVEFLSNALYNPKVLSDHIFGDGMYEKLINMPN